jgi:ectoine hydroxylase-related dioxygenase (phytanoyl-CoA dioxygenase family)
VQCTLFEKSADRNWLVPYHQDLMIPVKQRVDDDRLTGWSEKEGTLYVQPPREVLESLVALRVHIDDCGPTQGPLRVVPGSHRFGVLSNEQAATLRETHGEHACTVERSGIVAMKPLVLHASSKASEPNRRRVLHILFGPAALPYGLEWNLP